MAKRTPRWLGRFIIFLLVLLLASYSYWTLKRPLPDLKPSVASLNLQTAAPELNWPAMGQSAVGIVGTSILNVHNQQTPVPTASTAKLITVLTVLKAKPLPVGQQGPLLTLTASDAALYSKYVAEQGSVVPVQAGEQISEYQALEAILLPSANNVADSLAIWAFGSLPAYQTAATAYLQQLGLKDTHVGVDASGFDPSTTSTAHDLVVVGEQVMQNPVLASIVGQANATGIPLTTSVKNVNFLLGTDNVVGIKTGNTDQAGGVFVSASRTTVNNKIVTIVTALAAAPTLAQALQASVPLILSAQSNFRSISELNAGAIVGHYQEPWGGSIPITLSKKLVLTTWQGSTTPTSTHVDTLSVNTLAGQIVGSVTSSNPDFNVNETVPLQIQSSPSQPTAWWRLLHPIH